MSENVFFFNTASCSIFLVYRKNDYIFSDDLAIKQWTCVSRSHPLAISYWVPALYWRNTDLIHKRKKENIVTEAYIYSGLIEADIRFIQYRFHCIWKHRNKKHPEKLYVIFKCNLMTTKSTVICKLASDCSRTEKYF